MVYFSEYHKDNSNNDYNYNYIFFPVDLSQFIIGNQFEYLNNSDDHNLEHYLTFEDSSYSRVIAQTIFSIRSAILSLLITFGSLT